MHIDELRIRGMARHGGWLSATALTAAVLMLAGCASATAPSSRGAVRSGGTATFALDENVAGFNSLGASDNELVLTWIMDQTLPRVFVVQPDLKPVLDTEFVTSATEVRANPQTIVYQISPRAVWSDGVPITAADFIYNWKAQSGNPAFRDVGGKLFQPAAIAGYSQIRSVTGSNHGRTVTVVFSQPYGDWQTLFSQNLPLLPAHIAQKVGFDSGFQDFGAAVRVSGGPYQIQSYTPGKDIVEVRNPRYWGPPGKLSKIIFRFILDDAQQPAAVRAGEVNVVNPVLASASYLDAVRSIPGFTVAIEPSLEFQHLDFNEANPYLALPGVRHAIAYGTNRQQMISQIVAPLTSSIRPLQNRLIMPTEPGYANTGGGYGDFDPAKARALLRQAGMTMGSDGYFHPGSGPEKGRDFTLTISTTSGEPVRSQIEQLFQADMRAIGVKIVIRNYSANVLFGAIAPKAKFDIIEFAWAITPFKSENESVYCSYTLPACSNNWDHYADPRVDALFSQALTTTGPAAADALYNQIDRLLWSDMASLPLFQDPDLFGWSSRYANIIPDTSNIGIAWNADIWGLRAGRQPG